MIVAVAATKGGVGKTTLAVGLAEALAARGDGTVVLVDLDRMAEGGAADWADLAERSAGASGALLEQVCLDAKRVAVLAGKPQADETEVFRRLALAMALASGVGLSTLDDEIRWLSTADAAKRVGITPRTLYRFIDNGELPAYRFGRVIRLKESEVDRFIESCRIEPGTLEHLYPDSAAEISTTDANAT